MYPYFPYYARMLRTVRNGSVSQYSVVDFTEGVWFSCDHVGPTGSTPIESTDGPPRENPAGTLRWATGAFGPGDDGPLAPGDRVRVTTTGNVVELISAPTNQRLGRRSVQVVASVMTLEDLYPLSCEIEAQGGAQVRVAVPIAIWNHANSEASRGSYDEFTAECPIDYVEDLTVQNRQVVLQGRTWRVMNAHVPANYPAVQMNLRSPKQ